MDLILHLEVLVKMVDRRDINKLASKSPQAVNQDSRAGSYKGIVVDVRDPAQLGRVRVWAYPIHGDLNGLDINTIPWAEPKHGFSGSFDPPEIFDRVWLDFEGGDRYTPTYFGSWYGIPAGRGTLPHDRTVGTEVRPENWNHHDLYPETNMVAMSAEGNGLWLNSLELDGDNLVSSINIMDTGSKTIKTKSIHIGESDFAPVNNITGSLYQANIEEGVATRDGFEGTKTDSVPGAIEITTQNLKVILETSTNTFSVYKQSQIDSSGDIQAETTWVEGSISRMRLGKSSICAADDALFLASPVATAGIFLSSFMAPPKRWD